MNIDAILTGRARPLGTSGIDSAIAKAVVTGPVAVNFLGLEGDEQADLRVHGGPDKAVHHYPRDHYVAWRAELLGAIVDWDRPGAFGENISTIGMTEADICVGDLWRAGDVLLEVSQARQPCWKLNYHFGIADMSERVQTTQRTGWYYRVIEPGVLVTGVSMRLIERPYSGWPLTRLLHHLYVDVLNRPALEEMAAIPQLAESWRKIVLRRLETGGIENWDKRLFAGAR